MTGPRVGPATGMEAQYGLESPLAQSEWQQFMQRRQELINAMIGTGLSTAQSSGLVAPVQPVNPVANQPAVADPTLRPQGRDELIARARAWDIPNPESLSDQDLQNQIALHRQEIPRDEQTSVGSASLAILGAASEAAAATTHVLGNVLGLVDNIPFAGPTLAKIAKTEHAKYWMYDLAQQAQTFSETAGASQPKEDQGAYQFMTGTGKMAGYALPAMLAWEGLGMTGAFSPAAAWATRFASPALRAAVGTTLQGAATGTVLEAGSDEPLSSKIKNIGLGAILGGTQGIPGVGRTILGATVGAGIGGNVGATPEEQQRNAMIGGAAGGVLGALAPLAAVAFQKVTQDIPSPFTSKFNQAQIEGRANIQAEARVVSQQALPSGEPDYTVENDFGQGGQPAGPQAMPLVRSDNTGEKVSMPGFDQPTQPAGPAPLSAAPEQPRLMSPERAIKTDLVIQHENAQANLGPGSMSQSLGSWRSEIYGQPPAPEVPPQLSGTKVVDIRGVPKVVYHGTGAVYDQYDPAAVTEPEEQLFGPGFYTTDDPAVASTYARGDNPNVRPMRLNIQNPFEIDRPYSEDEVNSIVDKLSSNLPGYDWETTRRWIHDNRYNYENTGPITGEDIYNNLAFTNTLAKVQGPKQREDTRVDFSISSASDIGYSSALGKASLNQALQSIGYDGIAHKGGTHIGTTEHNVWIAFDPKQIHSPWNLEPMTSSDAASQGIQMSKQSTIMEGSELPQNMAQGQIGDSDVAKALKVSNPAGASVLKGINADQPTIAKMLYDHPEIQFVQRYGRLDALVGKITPAQVSQYGTHGVFEGMQVTLSDGRLGSVVAPPTGDGFVTVMPQAGGPPLVMARENVMASRYGSTDKSVPMEYELFKSDMLDWMNSEAKKAGMAPVQDMTDPRVGSMLSYKMNDYFDKNGINTAAERQVLDQQFNQRWVEEFRNLDPQSRDLQARMQDWAAVEHNEKEGGSNPTPVSLEEKSEAKGFIWTPNAGGGGNLRDTLNPEGAFEFPVGTDVAAHDFLEHVDRAANDITPVADVPAEVALAVPTASMREPVLGTHETVTSLENTLKNMSPESGGGGGAGGSVPPSGPGSGSDFGGQQQLPPSSMTLGEQFQNLRKADPVRLHALTEELTTGLRNSLRYKRYQLLHMETKLTDAGIDMARNWSMVEAMDAGHAQSVQEGSPWIEEWGKITREFPNKALRDGTVTRIHEMDSTNDRMLAIHDLMKTKGLSEACAQRWIAADAQITDFMHRFAQFLAGDKAYDFNMDREIFRYMPHVRARQNMPNVSDPYAEPGLNPNVEFFAEHAREGNMQFRVMDARELGVKMVRAAMFHKHEAAAYKELVDAWQDPRIPEPLQNYMLDYAKVTRMGYDASGEVGVRGIKMLTDKILGVPVTTREAQHIMNIPRSGMYMAMLAGRTSIFFRDAIQPLIALAKVEIPYMAGVYRDVLKGAGQKLAKSDFNKLTDMYYRGLDGGWIERENPGFEAAGVFEEQPALRDNELMHINKDQAQGREMLASIGDKFQGLPNWLIRPSESAISTLKVYGRQGQLHRLIVGESAYRQTETQLQAYRKSQLAAAMQRDPSLAMNYDQFADKAYFNSFEPPIQRKLKELVDSNDDEGAKNLFAREVANWSQFRYGRKEQPKALQGEIGQWLFTLGNFSGQFLEGMISGLSNGTARQKARLAMVIGGVTLGLEALKKSTGWSFDKWAWTDALKYTGGPLLSKLATGVAAYQGGVASAGDLPVSETEKGALKDTFGPSTGSTFGDMFNPYGGYERSSTELNSAMQGTNPLEQSARYVVTGDRGSRIDWARTIEKMAAFQGGHAEGAMSPNGGHMAGHPGADSGNIDFRQYQPNTTPGLGGQQ